MIYPYPFNLYIIKIICLFSSDWCSMDYGWPSCIWEEGSITVNSYVVYGSSSFVWTSQISFRSYRSWMIVGKMLLFGNNGQYSNGRITTSDGYLMTVGRKIDRKNTSGESCYGAYNGVVGFVIKHFRFVGTTTSCGYTQVVVVYTRSQWQKKWEKDRVFDATKRCCIVRKYVHQLTISDRFDSTWQQHTRR